MVFSRGFRRGLIATLLYVPAAFSALFETSTNDLAAAVVTARTEKKQLMVMFEQADCGYCERMKRTVLRDTATETAITHRFHTVAVSLDSDAMLIDSTGKSTTVRELASRLHLLATPVFVFYDGNGQILYRYAGVLTEPADFQLLGRYVSDGAYEQQPFAEYRRQRRP
ncbi:MAG: thioredoxin fold domain-containing protein [Candidatus Competibacteraceae bacterium]